MRSWGASQKEVGGSTVDIRRRTIVQFALASLVLTGCSETFPELIPAAAKLPADGGNRIPPERPEPRIRYQFDCSEADGLRIGMLSSLEEVWASTRYVRLARCEVRYVGGGPHALTPEEEAAVQVAIAAGASTSDKSALFLRILEVCTRTNPQELDLRLSRAGVAVVKGALAFAPSAPQAVVLERWLQRS